LPCGIPPALEVDFVVDVELLVLVLDGFGVAVLVVVLLLVVCEFVVEEDVGVVVEDDVGVVVAEVTVVTGVTWRWCR
jgi:hypothetical protein